MINTFCWVKNNLIDIFTSKAECHRDLEFSRELQKEYKNYSTAVIQEHSSPAENIVTMDVEVRGRYLKSLEANYKDENFDKDDDSLSDIMLNSEKGDMMKVTSGIAKMEIGVPSGAEKRVTDLEYSQFAGECRREHSQRLELLEQEREQDETTTDTSDVPQPFRTVGKRSSLTNLHTLMEQCPPPQPTLNHKQIRRMQISDDQPTVVVNEISKMKNSMERLQDIIRQFNCTEKFKQDIDFIIGNVGPAITKAELVRHLENAPCILQSKNKTDKR